MSGQVGAALALALALVLSPGFAGAQSQVEGELNRAKAAMQLKKYDEAAVRFEKLARTGQGYVEAQAVLGFHYMEGVGVAQSYAEAARVPGCARTGPKRRNGRGSMYQFGRGVAKNCKTAVEWYARGALQNDHGNLYSLARMYHYGFGVKEDRAKAHALYRHSAALGNLKARGALVTFDRFSWPDQRSQDIYNGRGASYMSAINGCQLRANAEGRAVTCLVPGVDWNPKTWESC